MPKTDLGKRIQGLFTDETKSELKPGVTVKQLSTLTGMVPLSNSELQEDLQKAHQLIYDRSMAEINKVNGEPLRTPASSTTINPLPQLTGIPSVSNMPINQEQQQYKQPTPEEGKNVAAELAEMYNKVQGEKAEKKEMGESKSNTNLKPVLSPQEYEAKIKKLEDLNLEKDKEIHMLKDKSDEDLNKEYEVKFDREEIKKDTNFKVETHTSSPVLSDETLVRYLKEVIERLEQKNSWLLQENGKLKNMLGL